MGPLAKAGRRSLTIGDFAPIWSSVFIHAPRLLVRDIEAFKKVLNTRRLFKYEHIAMINLRSAVGIKIERLSVEQESKLKTRLLGLKGWINPQLSPT